jgi:hypothetical protein
MSLLKSIRLDSIAANQTNSKLQELSSLLLLETSEEGISVCSIERIASQWNPRKELTITWSSADSKLAGSAEGRGRILLERLRAEGISTKQVIVSISRRKAVLKLLELAAVDDSLLASAVALEAEARGHGTEEFVVDFVAQPATDDSTYVLMAAYQRAAVEELTTLLAVAELKPLAFGLGEVALSRLASASADAQPTLVLFANPQQLDFVVTRYANPIATFSMPLPREIEQHPTAIDNTIRRLINALPRELVQGGFHSITITGPTAIEIASVMEDYFPFEIEVINFPVQQTQRAWALLGNVDASIDFLNPRQSVDNRLLQRKAIIKWVTQGALSLVLIALLFSAWISQLDRQTLALQQNIRTKQRLIDEQQEILDVESQVIAWERSQVDWPTELMRFLQSFPGNERAYLKRIRMESSLDQSPTIQIEGVARELDDAFNITQELLSQAPRYQLQPEGIERNPDDPHYHVRFQISATLATDVAEPEPLPPLDKSANAIAPRTDKRVSIAQAVDAQSNPLSNPLSSAQSNTLSNTFKVVSQ